MLRVDVGPLTSCSSLGTVNSSGRSDVLPRCSAGSPPEWSTVHLKVMVLLRRILAIMLLASFAGSQPAAASCAMDSGENSVTTRAAAESLHMHHAVEASGAEDADASHTEDGREHRLPNSSQGTTCGAVMACAVAAIAAAPEIMPAVPFIAEPSVLVPGAAHGSPTLAFEPPPPRQILI